MQVKNVWSCQISFKMFTSESKFNIFKMQLIESVNICDKLKIKTKL